MGHCARVHSTSILTVMQRLCPSIHGLKYLQMAPEPQKSQKFSLSAYGIHTFRVSLLCYYSSFKFLNCCMVEVQGMCLRIAYA